MAKKQRYSLKQSYSLKQRGLQFSVCSASARNPVASQYLAWRINALRGFANVALIRSSVLLTKKKVILLYICIFVERRLVVSPGKPNIWLQSTCLKASSALKLNIGKTLWNMSSHLILAKRSPRCQQRFLPNSPEELRGRYQPEASWS